MKLGGELFPFSPIASAAAFLLLSTNCIKKLWNGISIFAVSKETKQWLRDRRAMQPKTLSVPVFTESDISRLQKAACLGLKSAAAQCDNVLLSTGLMIIVRDPCDRQGPPNFEVVKLDIAFYDNILPLSFSHI